MQETLIAHSRTNALQKHHRLSPACPRVRSSAGRSRDRRWSA